MKSSDRLQAENDLLRRDIKQLLVQIRWLGAAVEHNKPYARCAHKYGRWHQRTQFRKTMRWRKCSICKFEDWREKRGVR